MPVRHFGFYMAQFLTQQPPAPSYLPHAVDGGRAVSLLHQRVWWPATAAAVELRLDAGINLIETSDK